MSSFAKGFGGCLGVFGAICFLFVGGCVFMGFLASTVTTTGETDAPQVAVANAPPEPPKWVLTEVADGITGESIKISSIKSKNTFNLKFPYSGEQRATLTLRSQGDDVSVSISIERGQMFPASLQVGAAKASVRIDDAVIETPLVAATGLQTDVAFLTHERLPLMILRGKELRIEVELYHEANQVLVFDLTSGRSVLIHAALIATARPSVQY